MESLFSRSKMLMWLHVAQTVYQLFFAMEKSASIPLHRHCARYYGSCVRARVRECTHACGGDAACVDCEEEEEEEEEE